MVPADRNASTKMGVRFIMDSSETKSVMQSGGEPPAYVKIRLFCERLSSFYGNLMLYINRTYGKIAFCDGCVLTGPRFGIRNFARELRE